MQDRIVKRFFSASFFMWSSTVDKALQSVYFVILQIFKYSATTLTRSQMGQKNLVLLTGSTYYRGRLKFHDLRAIMTNTQYSAFAYLEQLIPLINNRNVVDIAYSN